jgi:membrane protein
MVNTANALLDRWTTTRIARRATLGFIVHEGLQYAGSMAYFAVISIVNLLVLGVVAASVVLGEGPARQFVVERVTAAAPIDPPTVVKLIDGAIAGRGGITVVGVVLVTWSTLGIFGALSGGVARVFARAPRRPFWKERLLALFLLATAGVLVVGSVAIGIFTDIVQRAAGGVVRALPGGETLFTAVGSLLPVLIIFVAFLVVYRLVPNRPITLRDAWPGAIIATLAWSALRIGFTLYATRIARYDTVFGPISTAVSLLVFLYFSSVVVLIGAEVVRGTVLEREAREAAATPGDAG